MRLREKDLIAIKELFKKYFLENDHLWLFGSRVDDTKKGGDIDLYIETECNDISNIYEKRKRFWLELQDTLGEQKIDIVIHRIKHDFHIRIYDVARETGVKLV
jgi:hypothetical protein